MNPERVVLKRAELFAAIGQVCDDLGMPLARALWIIAPVHELEKECTKGWGEPGLHDRPLPLWGEPEPKGT